MEDQLRLLQDAIINGKKEAAVAGVKQALESGTSAETLMRQGLIPAMEVVGEKYSTGEFFLPQMMIAARAMGEAVGTLRPALTHSTYEVKGKAVVGTVAGDFHDIGKNIVKMMLEGSGYDVTDLGTDVSPEAFVEAIRAESPRFVLISTLITLTMQNMRKTVEAIQAAGVRDAVVIGVGGAPVTQKFAEEIGADFYAEDAYECAETCNRFAA